MFDAYISRMPTMRATLDHDDKVWLVTVLACCALVAAILLGWSQLRSY
jgi:hypothetical protein